MDNKPELREPFGNGEILRVNWSLRRLPQPWYYRLVAPAVLVAVSGLYFLAVVVFRF